MSKVVQSWERDGFTIRLAQSDDAEAYFQQNFNPLDSEVARLTGSKTQFSRDEVVPFFEKCLTSSDRYDFIIISKEGRILGESIINEIDYELRSANFRICIFQHDARNKGIGSWAILKAIDFSFDQLKLHRLELNVFSFNKRAINAYLKVGFKIEGVLRESVLNGQEYADNIIMSMLDWEYENASKLRA